MNKQPLASLLGVEVEDMDRADANFEAGEYPDDGRADDEAEYVDWLDANGLEDRLPDWE